MNVSGIGEIHLIVIPAVAGVCKNIAASGGRRLRRVRSEKPVAKIDDMDILLDQDVTGQGAVPEPVAQAVFVRRGAGMNLLE